MNVRLLPAIFLAPLAASADIVISEIDLANNKVTESTSLDGPFTDVLNRTGVFNTAPGRFQFDVIGEALFFRLEEE